MLLLKEPPLLFFLNLKHQNGIIQLLSFFKNITLIIAPIQVPEVAREAMLTGYTCKKVLAGGGYGKDLPMLKSSGK